MRHLWPHLWTIPYFNYSARRLMGSQLIESAAYCNQILLAQQYINSAQNTSVNWIIWLLLSLLSPPKVILLSGGHFTSMLHTFLSIFTNMAAMMGGNLSKKRRRKVINFWKNHLRRNFSFFLHKKTPTLTLSFFFSKFCWICEM